MRCLIVGPAKSGTTALLYAVAKSLGEPAIYFEEPIAALRALPPSAAAKLIFEHEAPADIVRAAESFDRRVLLVRDPRDSLVSRLLYFLVGKKAVLQNDAFLTRFIELLRAKSDDPLAVPLSRLLGLVDEVWEGLGARTIETFVRFADFIDAEGTNWFRLRYEDLITNDLGALSAYLGVDVDAGDVVVDSAYSRVARTKASGDWRVWFTPQDVATMAPLLNPVMERLGYRDSWELAGCPRIDANHAWKYVLRLVEERRAHYGLPPFLVPQWANGIDVSAAVEASPISGSSVPAAQGNAGPLPSFLDPLGGPDAKRQVWGRTAPESLPMNDETHLDHPEPPLPPKELMFMDSSHAAMLQAGSDLLDLPEQLALWSPEVPVFDLGCGYGRLAYALLRRGQRAPYFGVDILPRHIAWLKEHLQPCLPTGSALVHLDVQNDRYNPEGRGSATEVTLPRPDWSPGLVLMFSVFTHMYPDEVRRYALQLADLMPLEGAACVTMFLLNSESRRLHSHASSAFHFHHRHSDSCFMINEKEPLHAVAFDEGWVHAMLRDCGLRIEHTFYGNWCARAGARVYQDTLILRRR
jgi:SAM-dependent methyltransferase